jgi:predicted XRE-type DNA-binding protein
MIIEIRKFDKITRLLKEGRLSQNKIALRVGVSRPIISEIANGKHCLQRPEIDREKIASLQADEEPLPEEEGSSPGMFSAGELGRCPICGAKVFGKCRACRIRSQTQGEPHSAIIEAVVPIHLRLKAMAPLYLGLNLTPSQMMRYEEIRRSGRPGSSRFEFETEPHGLLRGNPTTSRPCRCAKSRCGRPGPRRSPRRGSPRPRPSAR